MPRCLTEPPQQLVDLLSLHAATRELGGRLPRVAYGAGRAELVEEPGETDRDGAKVRTHLVDARPLYLRRAWPV